MKILCMGKKNNPSCLGGVETFERNLNKIFKKEIVFYVFSNNIKKYFNINGVIEFDFNKNIKMKIIEKIIGKNRYLLYKAKRNKYDVLIYNSPNDLKKFYKLGAKNILVQHGSWKYYYQGTYKKNPKLVTVLKENLDCYVFLSKYDQEKFVKGLELDINRTAVIRHSCEIELLENSKKKNKKLIMITRLDNNQKRIDLAINVMKKLSNYTLEIYGDGPDKEYLENLIYKNSLKNVFLCGGTNQVKEKLDESAIFIMTSDTEGYPISLIEAMRRGLPIILRNTFEAAQDIIKDNGILLEQEWNEEEFVRAVEKIYKNYEFYSKNSIEMGKRHNFDVIENQWKKLIDGLKNGENKKIY